MSPSVSASMISHSVMGLQRLGSVVSPPLRGVVELFYACSELPDFVAELREQADQVVVVQAEDMQARILFGLPIGFVTQGAGHLLA